MPEFKEFAKIVNDQFEKMVKQDVFVVSVTKDELWDTYLNAFPEGTNEIYVENRKHDCNCCKQFIRNIGGMVTIVDDKLVSVWDIKVPSFYQEIADAMSALVKSRAIQAPFKRSEKKYGLERTTQMLEVAKIKDGVVINAIGDIVSFDHFYSVIPSKYLSATPSNDISNIVAKAGTFNRALAELKLPALEQVKELIANKKLYLGDGHRELIDMFIKAHKTYHKEGTDTNIFVWSNLKTKPANLKKTSSIGSLIADIGEIAVAKSHATYEAELTKCIKAYNKKTDPTTYQRAEAAEISKAQAKLVQKTIEDLGIEPSLSRRLAVAEDVSVNNVLHANSETRVHMKDSISDLLASAVKPSGKSSKKATTDIHIDDFTKDVLPGTSLLEMYLANSHKNNLMTLISPTDTDAPNLFKWNNNSSWSYNGNITDSLMRDNVKALGGKVDGQLRGSIQWNEEKGDNRNDLDIHCVSPKSHISYQRTKGSCGGQLDVDIQEPGTDERAINGVAVENISWAKNLKLPNGEYKFYVNNYAGRNTGGFRAELEINGETYSFNYNKPVTRDVVFATVTHKDGKFTVKSDLDSQKQSKNVYGIPTEEFHKVTMAMLSPNYWDGQEIGNKHHFFILEGCTVDEPVNGFYNEFLSNELHPHRKVFEVLSAKMRCPVAEQSLSGLGFSSTKRDSVLVRADGRTYNIKF